MFIVFNPKEQKWPIKVWLEDVSQIEKACFEQAKNLSNLPFIHQWFRSNGIWPICRRTVKPERIICGG